MEDDWQRDEVLESIQALLTYLLVSDLFSYSNICNLYRKFEILLEFSFGFSFDLSRADKKIN